VAVHTALAADRDEVTEPGRAGNADLRDDHTVASDLGVVRDLHLVVDLGALAHHRVTIGAPIDGRIGADLNVVLDDYPADLGDFHVAARTHGKTKTILADANAWMNDDAVADERVL
jgi:hypothetical protein